MRWSDAYEKARIGAYRLEAYGTVCGTLLSPSNTG
jgi:hypothetical protein